MNSFVFESFTNLPLNLFGFSHLLYKLRSIKINYLIESNALPNFSEVKFIMRLSLLFLNNATNSSKNNSGEITTDVEVSRQPKELKHPV